MLALPALRRDDMALFQIADTDLIGRNAPVLPHALPLARAEEFLLCSKMSCAPPTVKPGPLAAAWAVSRLERTNDKSRRRPCSLLRRSPCPLAARGAPP
jgi:hypothetical protein